MEPKFIEMAKTIIQSLDHYRDAGRDDIFNEVSIAEYLERQQLLNKHDVSGRSEQLPIRCTACGCIMVDGYCERCLDDMEAE